MMSLFTAQRHLQMIVVVGSPDSHYIFTRLQCHIAEDGYFQGFLSSNCMLIKGKGLPRQAEVAQGVPGRLRPQIFLTFRHYKGGRLSAKRTGRLYPRRNPWHFQRLSRPQGTWFCRGYHGKNPQ